MAVRSKPYESLGPYILFRKLEEHSLGEVWRAGRTRGKEIHTIALHRLSGGKGEALSQSIQFARSSTSQILGTSVVRNQILDVVEGTPVVEHEYGGGRTLRHIVAKAKNGTMPHPIAVEQALSIAERAAASVELVHNFRREGVRTVHGAVVPHLVWVESDGEIQTAGQQLGKGLLGSLANPAAAREIQGYIAPEVRSFGEPSAAGDIYSIGGILYLVLTGEDPPDASNPSAFSEVVGRATLMSREPIPQEIRAILQRALSPDINKRYGTAAELRKELGSLLHGGKFAPTTFNLAFFLHSLLKKEFEGESVERQRESKVNAAMYAPKHASPAAADAHRTAGPGPSASPRRTQIPLIAAAAVVLVAVSGFGAWMVLGRGREKAMQIASAGGPARPARRPSVITAVGSDSPEIAATEQTDTAEVALDRQKRIEDEIQRRVQSEMTKLQAEYDRELEQRTYEEASERSDRRRPELSASAGEFVRRESEPVREEQPRPSLPVPTPFVELPVATNNTARAVVPPPLSVQPPPQQTSAPVVEEIREGDLVGISEVDQQPKPRSPIRPVYPPMAMKQRSEGTVYLTALISETGQVIQTRVLQGDPPFVDSALRAVRNASFTPAMKNGQRVKTWLPIPIRFKL